MVYHRKLFNNNFLTTKTITNYQKFVNIHKNIIEGRHMKFLKKLYNLTIDFA